MSRSILKRKPKGEPLTLNYFFERSRLVPYSGCWLWLGATLRNGYGVVNVGGSVKRAHRESYQIANKILLPSSVDVCHRCDVRNCVNPDHLFHGSRADNMRDCANKGRTVIPGMRGEQLPQSVLTETQVLEIRASVLSQRELGRRFGVDKGTIANVVHRKTWRHV